jgi:hypothetical protein
MQEIHVEFWWKPLLASGDLHSPKVIVAKYTVSTKAGRSQTKAVSSSGFCKNVFNLRLLLAQMVQ